MDKEKFYSMPLSRAYSALSSSPEGLSDSDAKIRLEKWGHNEIREKPPASPLTILISQFKSPLISVLIVVAVIAIGIQHYVDAVGILIAVSLAALSGFVQEYKAERSLDALRRMEKSQARVMRGKKECIIPSSEIVPGDAILFSEGEKIPADARIIEAINLSCDEALLTGESRPSAKDEAQLKNADALHQQSNIVFARTAVSRGRGRAIVFATGMNTEFGKVAETLSQTEEEDTPMQKSMEELGQKISAYVILLAIAYLILGLLLFGRTFQDMFLISITLVVMAVPEGLPTIMAVTLAIGMQNMAKRNAIIRKLPAVEALGSTTIICTDKTGTLTKNKLAVRKIFLPGGEYGVEGDPDSFSGKFSLIGSKKIGTLHSRLETLVEACAFCNNASVVSREGREIVAGDPTESALIIMAKKFGYDVEGERAKSKFACEIPFDSGRKMMSVGRRRGGKSIIYVKGAPEAVVKKCVKILDESGVRAITSEDLAQISRKNSEFSAGAMRVLAVAYKEVSSFPQKPTERAMESGLTFAGLVGMMDPPRPEVYDAVAKCTTAGIRVIVITGDGKDTAFAIAHELGIAKSPAEAIEGLEIDPVPDEKLAAFLGRISVIARASPQHKFRIVSALMAAGQVVAVTGDGVNDAPAIKKASIGISMGISGTDVAKEVSDMVLSDDNFATIVQAVKYGRRIYDNIKSFVRYQFSTNVAALITMFATQFLGMGLPLTVLQMLWINIIMDGPPAVALGFEKSAPDTMERKPRNPKTPFVTRNLVLAILFAGATMAAGTVALFSFYLGFEPRKAGTVAFTAFVAFQFANALNCKSRSQSIFRNFFSNTYLLLAIVVSMLLHLAIIYLPFFQGYFRTVPLGLFDWGLIGGAALLVVLPEEIKKAFFARHTEY